MAGRGLHIALTDEEVARLEALATEDVPDFIANELEESKFGTVDTCETDKSWAYIHAAFNGTDPDGELALPTPKKSGFLWRLFLPKPVPESGPAKYAIVGTRQLVDAEEYFVGLIPTNGVAEVASGLRAVSESDFRQRMKAVYQQFQISGNADEASDYALGWLPGLIEFFDAAAMTKKNVIFTVDF